MRHKTQLIINIVLTIITLFSLIITVVAWFSTVDYAKIKNLDMQVERQSIEILKTPLSFLFPCATKIADVTKEDFNAYCCIKGTYTIKEDGKIYTDITGADGVLGFALDESDGTDYYTLITTALKEELNTDDLSSYSYDALKRAMKNINLSRRVGKTNADGNTEVTIVCWTEYDSFTTELNQIANNVYVYNEISDLTVDVSFIR